MRKSTLFIFSILISVNVEAHVVSSCDGVYSARIGAGGGLVIQQAGRYLGVVKTDHAVDGGLFSPDDSILIAFGLPTEIDARSPKITRVSIYSVKPTVSLIHRVTYGGGVYDVAFSDDQNYVFVNNQYGVDVIDIRRGNFQPYDSTHVPQFTTQQCRK
ncbi:hypothetical protein [Paraburkholderia hospita]|uniref:hypothetical protein n=1 Tax=Paraburkholderia hospita TaxID=169430 RepID=UPI0008A7E77B|nr:hypothetical protein [Paraburkholderia hospita]SEH48574.1 hypothetical protein SAMN05192544_1002308 [Paraburkholderia hospita]